MPQRKTVENDLYLALAPYDLHGFTEAIHYAHRKARRKGTRQ